jgi:cytochrome c553
MCSRAEAGWRQRLRRPAAPFAMALLLAAMPAPVDAQPRGPVVASCAPCHGLDGVARDVETPHLAGQNEVYLLNQMEAFRTGRRRHPEMNFMARELSQRDIRDIIAYFAALPPR